MSVHKVLQVMMQNLNLGGTVQKDMTRANEQKWLQISGQ